MSNNVTQMARVERGTPVNLQVKTRVELPEQSGSSYLSHVTKTEPVVLVSTNPLREVGDMALKVSLSQAIAEYCDHMEARQLAASTIHNRKVGLNLLFKITGEMYVDNINHRHIDQVFAAYNWQTSARNLRLSQYRAFFAWCRNRRYMSRDSDPTFGWRSLKVIKQERERIPASEWPALFAACQHQQERIMLATGLFLFLRGSEQQMLQVKHVHLEDGEIEVYRRKTREWDRMPISAELDTHLREHLQWLAAQGAAEPDHYLIPSRDHDLQREEGTGRLIAGTGGINPRKPLSKPYKAVQRVLARLGYNTEGEGEHTLRRSGARAYFDVLVESGYDGALRRVQAMLGHKSSAMTEIYLGLDLDRRQRNEDIKGKAMFPILSADLPTNVVRLRKAQ